MENKIIQYQGQPYSPQKCFKPISQQFIQFNITRQLLPLPSLNNISVVNSLTYSYSLLLSQEKISKNSINGIISEDYLEGQKYVQNEKKGQNKDLNKDKNYLRLRQRSEGMCSIDLDHYQEKLNLYSKNYQKRNQEEEYLRLKLKHFQGEKLKNINQKQKQIVSKPNSFNNFFSDNHYCKQQQKQCSINNKQENLSISSKQSSVRFGDFQPFQIDIIEDSKNNNKDNQNNNNIQNKINFLKTQNSIQDQSHKKFKDNTILYQNKQQQIVNTNQKKIKLNQNCQAFKKKDKTVVVDNKFEENNFLKDKTDRLYQRKKCNSSINKNLNKDKDIKRQINLILEVKGNQIFPQTTKASKVNNFQMYNTGLSYKTSRAYNFKTKSFIIKNGSLNRRINNKIQNKNKSKSYQRNIIIDSQKQNKNLQSIRIISKNTFPIKRQDRICCKNNQQPKSSRSISINGAIASSKAKKRLWKHDYQSELPTASTLSSSVFKFNLSSLSNKNQLSSKIKSNNASPQKQSSLINSQGIELNTLLIEKFKQRDSCKEEVEDDSQLFQSKIIHKKQNSLHLNLQNKNKAFSVHQINTVSILQYPKQHPEDATKSKYKTKRSLLKNIHLRKKQINYIQNHIRKFLDKNEQIV